MLPLLLVQYLRDLVGSQAALHGAVGASVVRPWRSECGLEEAVEKASVPLAISGELLKPIWF